MTSSSNFVIDITDLSDSKSYLTRDQGSELKNKILALLNNEQEIVIDFSGAEALSPSFADELFAGLESALGHEFKKRIKIRCPKDDWRRLISSALTRRRTLRN